MPKDEEKKQLTSYDLFKANFNLAGWKVAAILPTQPLHVVMRHQQAMLVSDSPRVLSFFAAFKEIRADKSFASFFKGTGPGVAKELGRNITYKGALIKGAPNLADSLLPDSLYKATSPTQYYLIKAVFAGIIASASDTALGGWMESIATFRSTSHGKYANASFTSEIQQESSTLGKIRRLYRGFIPTAVKGTVAFSTFFVVTDPIQNFSATLFGLSPKDHTPWYVMATSSILCGFSVALTSSPFDIIKTQSQMPGAKGVNVVKALCNNYKIHGLGSVTAGLPAKTIMITIGWALNFFATQEPKEDREQHKETNKPRLG